MIWTFIYPHKDADLLTMLANFNSLVAAAPTTYGLTTTQATQLTSVFTAFQTALLACEKSVRNETSVIAKNQARVNVKAFAYNLAMIIAGVSTVTESQKLALGIKPRAVPSPWPVPSVSPILEVLSTQNFTVSLRLRSPTGGTRGSMPPGVRGINIFSYVGPTVPEDIAAWKFEGGVGQAKVDVTFSTTLPPGAKVWLTGFYFNNRKESGPACPPISANLPGGGVSKAA